MENLKKEMKMTKEKETFKAMDKNISKKFTYRMNLYTLIEKLKDIQSRCENEGKDVEVVIQNDCEELHAYSVDVYDNIVFLNVKE